MLRGAAWSAPVVAVSAVAPAMALSQQDARFDVLFDGGGGSNGFVNSAYLDLGTAKGSGPFTLLQPLIITVQVVGLQANATSERGYGVGSSNGSISRGSYDPATRTTTITWTIPAGTVIPEVGTATANPDILFSFRDGGATNRITNKIVVTGITNGGFVKSLPIDSTVVKDVSGVSPDGIY